MTPAIRVAKAAGFEITLHRYKHRAGADSYGGEAAAVLGLPPAQVLKTLIAEIEGGGLAVAIVPVDKRLDLKLLASALGAKRARMAQPRIAERASGYVIGGISPLGQRRRLPTVIDASVRQFPEIYVSGGRRGLDIGLAPGDLARACDAHFAPLVRAGT